MELKEYLIQNDLIKEMPAAFLKIIARSDTVDMAGCLTLWCSHIRKMYSPDNGVPLTPRKMFEYYIRNRKQKKCDFKKIVRLWLSDENKSGKTNIAALNEALEMFFKQYKSDVSAEKVQNFNIDQFAELFEDVCVCAPFLDFYSFFNPQTKNFIRYIDLPRVRNLPFACSRKHIKYKFDKNFVLVERYLENLYKNYYAENMFNGKNWDEYITDIVIKKISEGCLL